MNVYDAVGRERIRDRAVERRETVVVWPRVGRMGLGRCEEDTVRVDEGRCMLVPDLVRRISEREGRWPSGG